MKGLGRNRGLAVLLDPEKAQIEALGISEEVYPDYFFVGGSTGGDTSDFIRRLKAKIASIKRDIPVVLFPGNASQFSEEADGVLYLSLLSGRNPEYLVDQQISSARRIRESGVESIPTGYILIDGGVESSTMKVTQTRPMDPADIAGIEQVAIAAEMMGKQAIYLEAGSGAKTPVSPAIIRAVREKTTVPLIVGGGIRTREAMEEAYKSGADIVVIGNHFEDHPDRLRLFTGERKKGCEAEREADERFMDMAIEEARKALRAGEIPIGCVIVSEGRVIGRGHNLTETLGDVTAHAEMQAITAATQTVGGKYIPEATLYVTVEPCVMCSGAIGWAQIRRIVYGAADPKKGYTLYAPRALHPKASVTAGVRERECREVIQEFFKAKR